MENSIFTKLERTEDIEFINYIHSLYNQQVELYGITSNDLNRFSWTQNKEISLYCIKVSNDFSKTLPGTLLFATPSTTHNELFIADLTNETYTPKFTKLYGPTKELNWIIDNKFIPQSLVNKIIIPSIYTLALDIIKEWRKTQTSKVSRDIFDIYQPYIMGWIGNWFDTEYKNTLEAESHSTPVNHFPKTNQRYFVDKYHFDDMLKIINEDQFTDEFNQCLFAYEHEKWFICAAGLGSCIEHLMLIIIKNYDNKGYKMLGSLGKEPTARNYIACFRKFPIQISSRQERFFNSIFSLRNAVDHHNTGKTQRGICDLLLDDISDIFNDYYSNSVNIAPKSSQLKKQ